MTVARKEVKRPLGKGATFGKVGLKRLRQEDDTWEADFRALPKPIMQTQTHYLGMVVVKKNSSVLAESHVEGRPSSNDMAALLVQAMRRPLTESAHRPRRIHVRGHQQWRELFPHLNALGIKVSARPELPKVQKAYEEHLAQVREARRKKMRRWSGRPQTSGASRRCSRPSPGGWMVTATSRSETRRASASWCGH